MNASTIKRRHNHREVTVRIVRQRDGVPYEVDRSICADCGKVLSETPLRRAAA